MTDHFVGITACNWSRRRPFTNATCTRRMSIGDDTYTLLCTTDRDNNLAACHVVDGDVVRLRWCVDPWGVQIPFAI